MKFKSPNNEPTMIGLTSGHTMVVEPTGTEVPQQFRRAAIAAGCTPMGVGISEQPEASEAAETRQDVIKNAINKMLDGGEDGDFTNDGKPDLKKLSETAGFKVTRDERDAAWALVQASLTNESAED